MRIVTNCVPCAICNVLLNTTRRTLQPCRNVCHSTLESGEIAFNLYYLLQFSPVLFDIESIYQAYKIFSRVIRKNAHSFTNLNGCEINNLNLTWLQRGVLNDHLFKTSHALLLCLFCAVVGELGWWGGTEGSFLFAHSKTPHLLNCRLSTRHILPCTHLAG